MQSSLDKKVQVTPLQREKKMEMNKRKTLPRNVVAGSIWESRMKMDEVKGGIKVFNGEENHVEEGKSGDGSSEVVPLPITKTPEANQSSVVREKRKTWKPEPIEVIGGNPIQSRKIRLDPNKFGSKSVDGIDKKTIQIKHTRSHKDLNESCKEVGVCKEKTISSSLSSLSKTRTPKLESSEEDDNDDDDYDDAEEESVIEKKSFDVKEVDVVDQKPNKAVKGEKNYNQIYRKPVPLASHVNKQPSLMKDHPVVDQNLNKPPPTTLEEEYERFPHTQNKFQYFVDLVMWEDVAKSAFMFGFGTFMLISLSYSEDINLSLTSSISYMGLVYLAAIFLYKSIICRGETNAESSIHLIGEEDAISFLRLVLPYFNEILLKLKAIFSGDPATTMKLAVLLFVLARCGSFITIGKLVKLGFFGVFTLPKLFSTYSAQLSGYGKFSIQRHADKWLSPSQKKAVAIAAFILLWNFSSILTRIWAVFMVVVTIRYYQQCQQSSPCEKQSQTEVEESGSKLKQMNANIKHGDAVINTRQGGRRQPLGVWATRLNSVKDKKDS